MEELGLDLSLKDMVGVDRQVEVFWGGGHSRGTGVNVHGVLVTGWRPV